MMRRSDIVVTTTSALEGYTVSTYRGVVSAHVVAGTGLFSDVFASFSDVFGGRSQSYQKQLASINDEVIGLLRDKAKALGANCVLGLRIDHDEVSGGGKSMFMVTATGTATSVERDSAGRPASEVDSSGPLGPDEIKALIRKQQLVESAEQGKLKLDEETWEFLYRNQVAEVAPTILAGVEEALTVPHKYPDDFVGRAKAYFHHLRRGEAVETLYNAFSDEAAHIKLRQFARELIVEMDALDMHVAEEMLQTEQLLTRKLGLALLLANQPAYTPEDEDQLVRLRELVATAFPQRGREIEVEKRFSSKTDKRWECECGTTLSMEADYCISCGYDIRGFAKNELHPDHVYNLLGWRLGAIRSRFPRLAES
jgi:uncharacterized protein YbjQ (UPF0145 family)